MYYTLQEAKNQVLCTKELDRNSTKNTLCCQVLRH